MTPRQPRPEIAIFVARADNGVIGADGRLPWRRLEGDLPRFRTMTMGLPLIMGRKTFESLPGLLPGRRHIVLTRDAGWAAAGGEPAGSIDAALALAGDAATVAVIGGAEIYRLFLPRADRIELTEVHRSPDGDTRMPPPGPGWRVAARIVGGPDHDYVTLLRAS